MQGPAPRPTARDNEEPLVAERQPSELARLVKFWREQRRMSRERLSKLAGLSNAYVTLLESGRRGKRTSQDIVIALAQALDAPVGDFLAAAGYAAPAIAGDSRTTFRAVVMDDPLLRSDQKDVLLRLYSIFVGRTAG